MIIDNLCVFTDNKAIRANAQSTAVQCMPYLGKGSTALLTVAVSEAYPDNADIRLAVQESFDGATFTTLEEFDLPRDLLMGGTRSFSLPSSLRGTAIRLAYTVDGSPATGRLWAGLSRDGYEGVEYGQMVKPHR